MFSMILFLLFTGFRLTYWSIYHTLDISLTLLLLLTGQLLNVLLIENQHADYSNDSQIATCAGKPKTTQALESIKAEQPAAQMPGKISNVELSNDSQNATFVKGTDSIRALECSKAKQPAAQKPGKLPNADRSNDSQNATFVKGTENTRTLEFIKTPWFSEPSEEEAAHIASRMVRLERRRDARISIVENGSRRGPCHFTRATTRTHKPFSAGGLVTSEPLHPSKSEMALIEKNNEHKQPTDNGKAAETMTLRSPSTKIENENENMILKPTHFTKVVMNARNISSAGDSTTCQLLQSSKLEMVSVQKKNVQKKSTDDETAGIMMQIKPSTKFKTENMHINWMTALKNMEVPSYNSVMAAKEVQEKPLPISLSSIKKIAGRQGLARPIIITPSMCKAIEEFLHPILRGCIAPSVMHTALTILGDMAMMHPLTITNTGTETLEFVNEVCSFESIDAGNSKSLAVKSKYLDIVLDVKSFMHGSTARQITPSTNLQIQWHHGFQNSDSQFRMIEGRPTPPMLMGTPDQLPVFQNPTRGFVYESLSATGSHMPLCRSMGLKCPKEFIPASKPVEHGEKDKSPKMPPVPAVKGLAHLPDFTPAFTFSLPIRTQAKPTEPTPDRGAGDKHLAALGEVQAKLATQVQKQKEAKARLAKATSALRNTRKGNAGRNATKAKKDAAKALQACTDRVQALRVEEQELCAAMAA